MRAIRVLALFSIMTGATLGVATCGGDGGTAPTPDPTPPEPPPPANRAPTAVGSIAAQTILVGETVTVNVASNFSDPDGNALTYAVATSDAGVATTSASGSSVTINGVSAGTATVTVTARDPAGLTATQSIGVTVEATNQAPVAEGTIEGQTLLVGAEATVDVSANFSDPEGEELTYAATSSDTAVATVSTSGAEVTVMAIAAGSATVTVTATDPGEFSASQEFGVTVEEPNRAPEITDSIPPQTLTVGDTVQPGRVRALQRSRWRRAHLRGRELESLGDGTALDHGCHGDRRLRRRSGSTAVTVSVDGSGGSHRGAAGHGDGRGSGGAHGRDSIPTHDMIVDSMVTLDVSPYFEGGELTYEATTSDETVAMASVDGSTVTTTGVGAVEDSISVAILSVTATNESGSSVTQDSIAVRVHQEEYGKFAGADGERGRHSAGGVDPRQQAPSKPLPPGSELPGRRLSLHRGLVGVAARGRQWMGRRSGQRRKPTP